MEDLKVGDPIIYIDEVRRVHFGLITAAWSQSYINIVYVSTDENKTDPYGRQIERNATSVPPFGPGTEGGRCFKRFPKEATESLNIELEWIANNVQHMPAQK